MLRAYDKATGKDAGAVYMPAPQTGSPMTYMLNGKQYITVSIAGPGVSRRVVTDSNTGDRRHGTAGLRQVAGFLDLIAERTVSSAESVVASSECGVSST